MNVPTLAPLLGAVAGFLGVASGAFGAHALKARLPAELLAVWKTAVEYQLYHALALLMPHLDEPSRTHLRTLAAAYLSA